MSTAPGTHTILDHVILGCGALFDARRVPMATRLPVHPATDEATTDPRALMAARA